MRERLQSMGARIDWLLVSPYPLVTFRFFGDKVQNCKHSVFGITSQNAEQYIADFTIEQFGYNGETRWFLSLAEYMESISGDGKWHLANDEDLESHGAGTGTETGGQMESWREVLMQFAYGLDWEKLNGMCREDRLNCVEKQAREVFDGVAKEIWKLTSV
ncbi:hypothetical protein P280DRAFT_524135 [Massarina eburnea CBS 473.64]|uniref:Uncharacterized protein n=1 Tax=Massarina eburnea CBS 473.64 TaxID=1395130 RepID=A0A6A6RH83_9PLEO|nr:hypothetical protein P280DRAFT_524135 [Massarina eburnea CBS 473.64]